MIKMNSLLVFLILCSVERSLLKQLPPYISVCTRDPTTINDCARHSIEALRPQLMVGIPELDVPGIDPFYIKEIIPTLSHSSTISAVGKDVKVTGAGNFTIKSLSVDLDTFTIRARVRFPTLHLEGRYKLESQITVLPINGEGSLTADAVKCDAELVLHSQLPERNGVVYIVFTGLDMDINVKDYRIKLDGLFNGDKALGEAANQAINSNRGEFLRNAKPYLERTVSNLLLDFANRVVKDLTLDQLLPE